MPPVGNSASTLLQEAAHLEAVARDLLSKSKFDEALRAAYRVLEIRRKVLGDSHTDTWRTTELVADIHLKLGQLDQAETALRFDLAARERTLGPTSVQLAEPLRGLASVAEWRGNFPGAEQLHRRVLWVLEAGLGPSHPDVAGGSIRLGLFLSTMCRGAEAEPLLHRARQIQEHAFGPDSQKVADMWRHVAEARWIANDDTGAESSLQKAIDLLSLPEKERALPLMDGLKRLATMYVDRKLSTEAHATCERAVEAGERLIGASYVRPGEEAGFLWELCRRTGSLEPVNKLLGRLALVRIERTGPSVVAPAPAPEKVERCIAPSAPINLPSSPGNVGSASAVVAGMAPGFRRCYHNGLKEDPSITLSVRYTARVGPSGEVLGAAAFVPPGVATTVGECLLDIVFHSQFAPPEGGGATIVIPVTLTVR